LIHDDQRWGRTATGTISEGDDQRRGRSATGHDDQRQVGHRSRAGTSGGLVRVGENDGAVADFLKRREDSFWVGCGLEGLVVPSPFPSRRSQPMFLVRLVLNILWIVTGGLWMAAAWVIAGILLALTIIGLPWARAAFNIAGYTLLPFGFRVVRRDEYTGRNDLGSGPLGLLGNLIWLVLAGWWLALAHLITAVALAITIIGIPFAWAHLKLAGLALWPIGKMIVPADALPAGAPSPGRGYSAWG
jgi:uncharacterized membrane protein YccF (DUF307 family)